MENLKLLQTTEFLSTPIPEDHVPQRFAIATNFLLCADLSCGRKGLLLFNYEPQKWNQWYPYFSSVNAMYSFDGETYGDIVTVFNNCIMRRDDVQNRLAKAEREFSRLLGISPGQIKFGKSPVVPEMWLKYSKTQNLWTLYLMEFLQISYLPPINLESLDNDVVDFMPLTDDVIRDVLTTGKYRGIDVVDNTLAIIRDNEILSELKNRSISL